METTVELEGIHNFRAVAPYPLAGGGRIRPHTIFRSGALELMSSRDAEHLTATIRLSTVLDLRHPDEFAGVQPHALASAVKPLSLFPEHQPQEDLIAELNGLYGNGPSPQRYFHYLKVGAERFAQACTILSEGDSYPILVHCTAGKDRTGVLLALVMELLGARDEDIAAEYALSNASIDRLIAYLEASGRELEGTREEIRARLETPPERIAGFIDLLRQHFGSAADYFQSVGVPSERLDRIRDILADQAE
jgi:protein-tyrosine phosphatase